MPSMTPNNSEIERNEIEILRLALYLTIINVRLSQIDIRCDKAEQLLEEERLAWEALGLRKK